MKLNSISLYDDWLKIIKQELIDLNQDIENLDNDKISILYFSLEKRMISQKPREIKKHNDFICPEELDNGLLLLEKKIKDGEDLKPHQSRKLKEFDDNDALLFDWGIYHFHLGTEIDHDGFINRTGPLLFAMIDDTNIYFIGIYNHGAWTKKQMIKIVHNNWPEIIQQYRSEGIMQLEKNFDDTEIKYLRSANINTILEIEPSIFYLGPGGGISATGNSAAATLRYLDMRRQFEEIEKNLAKNPEEYLKPFFPNFTFAIIDKMDFILKKSDGKYSILEKNYGFVLKLGNE